ncbi:membrane-bound serine protease (ClpP class) [Desulfosporosinus orientis DSM 765]|uniref:Membrane-bound serine protease (ClpP class) n=1 Tax=Desulfosporosinus orientis (strain ATCC 19365 / DSM 765 / NCIMB 8382 / VKM B-1628 / Singapore I) TaxID=768706 RepID=G7WHL0_DESOD|nr:NfeD family protein [Desulfosporosinus orientis]AET70931.1 membrane-bound serine protease (ClpP class) [Desulfosporosinus orientis DSM 765]
MSQGFIIMLILIGIALLAVEVFVIPGFGVSGILGMASLITGIFLVTDTLMEGLVYTAISLFILGIIVFFSFRSARTRRIWKRFSLSTRQTPNEGYIAPKPQYEMYLGKVGTALTQLRPAGTGEFDGLKLDVVTEGGYIGLGTDIKVIAVEGTRIIVREVKNKEVKLGKDRADQ